MHLLRKTTFRLSDRAFPGRLPMLSCSLLMSLALAGCGAGDDPHTLTPTQAQKQSSAQGEMLAQTEAQAPTEALARTSATLRAEEEARIAAASFEQMAGERPHIVTSVPNEENFDWNGIDAWMANTLSYTMTSGSSLLGDADHSVDVFVDEFGNVLRRTTGLLMADASAQTLNNPGATTTDAAATTSVTARHPRPRPYRPASDADLPSWARGSDYNVQPNDPGSKPAAGNSASNGSSTSNDGSASNGSAGSNTAAGNTSKPTTPTAAATGNGSQSAGTGNAGTGSSTAQPASRNRLVTATNLQLDSPEFNRLYGPGVFTQNALANTVIGSYRNRNTVVSNRFRATVNGQLNSVRLYWQSGLGYAGGTGGVIRLSLYPDDGSSAHLPNLKAAPLASGTFTPGLKPGDKPKSIFPEIRMDKKSGNMVAGRLYHLVMENIDPNAHENFISSNNSITPQKNGRPARWLNTIDWSTLMGYRPRGSTRDFSWTNLTEVGSSGNIFSPILQLSLTNGQSQGVSDMEGGTVDNKLIYTATAQKPIREHFTPRSDKRISGISFATAASVAGRLQWRILDGNTELASGYVNENRPNYNPIQSNPSYKVGNFKWYDITLPQDVVMKGGRAYELEFRPEGNSQWKFGDHRNGSSYGYTWPAAFTESQAQLMLGGRWIGSNHWNHAQNGSGANWPVVLHLAP